MYKKIVFVGNLFLLIFFILVIYSSFIYYAGLKFDFMVAGKLSENRTKNKLPEFDIKDFNKFPHQFDQYFKDNFGFRESIIKANSFIMLNLYKISPVKKFILGKNEWVYYHSELDNNGYALSDYKGLTRFSDQDLNSICSGINDRYEWAKRWGIDFVIIIPPTKFTIYPEFVPKTIKKKSNETRLDQLIKYSNEHCDLKIIDVRLILKDQKNKHKYNLYFKGGTHWNQLGAYYAYREIMNQLAKGDSMYRPYQLSDFKYEITPDSTFDSGLNTIRDYYIELKLDEEKLGPEGLRKRADKLLTFSDSFTQVSLLPFLKLHFNEIVINDNFGIALKKSWIQERPDVVIYEALERNQHELVNMPAKDEIARIESSKLR